VKVFVRLVVRRRDERWLRRTAKEEAASVGEEEMRNMSSR
jgi:hypothetical protein